MSFDPDSGQLWAGNNGQDLWEQVYLIQKGANYGWSLTEEEVRKSVSLLKVISERE
jgi:glucose/arabinose dehydrogenase